MHFQGRPPDSTQVKIEESAAEQWRKIQVEAPQQAVTRTEDAAKQLIALIGVLQSLYFAVYAFSDLRKQIEALHIQGPGLLIWFVFFAPIVLWLISFYCATEVFKPKEHFEVNTRDISVDAWKSVRETYEKAAREKLRWLRRSHQLLALSFVAILIVLITFVLLPTPSETSPTQIIIVTPTSVAIPKP